MDLLDTLQRARTTSAPDATAFEGVRSLLAAEARRERRRHLGLVTRRWMAPLAGLAVLAGAGAAAYALTRTDPKTFTTIECGSDTFIPVESGSPIQDCRAALARLEPNVPPLVGWITPTGLVAVLPTGQAPPVGSVPLPTGFEVSRSILYVTDILADEALPIATTCTTEADAVSFANVQLRLAGLVGWNVQVRSQTGVASGGCVGYSGFPDPSTNTVYLQSLPVSAQPATNLDVRLDERLGSQLRAGAGASCASASQARTLLGKDAQDLGLSPSQYAVADAGTLGATGPSCAIVTIDPGGSIQAAIWLVPAGSLDR